MTVEQWAIVSVSALIMSVAYAVGFYRGAFEGARIALESKGFVKKVKP